MFRIDGPTAAAALPTPAAVSGTPGYFTEGDPSTSTPPTTVTADWANMTQEELMAVVLAGGLTPDKTDHTQLLQAMQALFVARTAPSFTHSGSDWRRIGPDGFIEIGGVVSLGTTNEQSISFTFATPFPTACLGIDAIVIANGSTIGNTQMQEISLSNTGATLFIQSDVHPFSDGTAFRFRARGY